MAVGATVPLVHAARSSRILLYVGDILAACGELLALGAWAVRCRDRWLLGWAALPSLSLVKA